MKKEMINAETKYVRSSARKMAIVLDMVRGKSYDEAVRILNFTNKKAAKMALKTLISAGANASNNLGIKTQNLLLKEAQACTGPALKRGRIVGRSRVGKILKKTSHIKIGLVEAK